MTEHLWWIAWSETRTSQDGRFVAEFGRSSAEGHVFSCHSITNKVTSNSFVCGGGGILAYLPEKVFAVGRSRFQTTYFLSRVSHLCGLSCFLCEPARWCGCAVLRMLQGSFRQGVRIVCARQTTRSVMLSQVHLLPPSLLWNYPDLSAVALFHNHKLASSHQQQQCKARANPSRLMFNRTTFNSVTVVSRSVASGASAPENSAQMHNPLWLSLTQSYQRRSGHPLYCGEGPHVYDDDGRVTQMGRFTVSCVVLSAMQHFHVLSHRHRSLHVRSKSWSCRSGTVSCGWWWREVVAQASNTSFNSTTSSTTTTSTYTHRTRFNSVNNSKLNSAEILTSSVFRPRQHNGPLELHCHCLFDLV